jgi:quinol monooxygenase YgiN
LTSDQITNGMKELAAAVEEKEPGALSYHYFLNEETKKIIVIEK